MPNSCLVLLKIQLINQLRLNDFHAEKDMKKRLSKIGLLGSFALLGIMLMVYCFVLAHGLVQMGLSHVIPSYALTFSCLLTFFFTLLKANGVLFASRDYEMLMALPIKTSTLIASRFLTMFLLNIIGSLLIMLPMGLAYALFNRPSLMFYIIWITGTVLASLIPTTLAAMIGAGVIFVASRFKYTNLVNTVLSFALIIGILVGPFLMQGTAPQDLSVSAMTDLSTLVSEQINRMYPIAQFFSEAVCDYNLISFVIFVGISIGWYYAFITLLATQYKRMCTSLTTHHTAKNFKRVDLQHVSPLKALYQKELKRLMTSSIYILNTGMGVLMTLIFGITSIILGKDQLVALVGAPDMIVIMEYAMPLILSAILAMSCTTCVSLSLEGKNLWIIQSAPVALKTIFDSKILVNLTLLIPSSLVSSALLAYAFKPEPAMMVLYFLTPLVYALFTGVWGIFINLKFPRFEWESDTQIVKQSMSSMAGLLGGPVFGLIPAAVLFMVPGINPLIFIVGITLAIGVITLLLYTKVSRLKRI